MGTFTFKPIDYISVETDLVINKRNNLNVEISSSTENNILSYQNIKLPRINGINVTPNPFSGSREINVTVRECFINSFSLDTLKVSIEDIKNKTTKKYILKN